ncbi:hypothetical protein [Streptomyces lavendofoliae]|uniref:Uncharacterized protein n=1 Tax=Streptomyces lavendofoliae TaxID=67314 RepID=A0A918M7I7_9ACTN|nr:hypothetical protein [Streptomyces lavendofoliae]GGU62110.1 hypothetical protein GCM10010274_58600 [Streptomyces lavendofoliae]
MADHAYIQRLSAELDALISEFRIPCLTPPYQRLTDLRVVRRDDGHGDGWAVLDHDNHAWTGTAWQPLAALSASDTYHYDRDTALNEAFRIAPLHPQPAKTPTGYAHPLTQEH